MVNDGRRSRPPLLFQGAQVSPWLLAIAWCAMAAGVQAAGPTDEARPQGAYDWGLKLPDNPVARRTSRVLSFEGDSPQVLGEIEGPGCLRRFWATGRNIGRDVVLRIYFDSQPVPFVEAPLGDFFGVMHNLPEEQRGPTYRINTPFLAVKPKNGMTCYFPMPFAKKARVEVTGTKGRRSWLYYQIDWHAYGKVHGPMLMNIIDVRERTCPQEPLPLDEAWRVTRRGRRGPGGGNLYMDQPAIRAMVALSSMTGDRRYAAFAESSLRWTMENLVDEKGFFWWGWHRHYDAYRDEKTGHSGNPHEIHVQQVIWPQLWKTDPRAARREIEAIWTWHVIDRKTGECNRHGDGQRGCDFAMSGGEILHAFAFLYRQTGDRTWLDRARLVADYLAERMRR